MGKVLCFSDSHLRDTGSFAPFNKIDEKTGLTYELLNVIKGFEFVADKIREFEPEYVFFLGDFYHVPEFITTRTLHASDIALSLINKACSETCSEFVMMPGNHDVLNEHYGITSVNNLIGYARILPLNENVYFNIGPHKVCVVPFNSSAEIFTKNVNLARDNGSKLIMTHQDFEGCKYESGYPSESKVSPRIGVPVISGDIHLMQQVGDVTYCGSLVQNRFNRYDLSGVGGVIVYDLDDGKLEHYKNDYSKHYVKVKDFDQIAYLDPDRCVLNINMKVDPDKLSKYLEDNNFKDYIHVNRNPVDKNIDEKVKSDVKVTSPLKSLRKHIENNNSEALDQYDELIKNFKNTD